MAKRKNKKKGNTPNLPAEVLERARRQAAGEDVDQDAPEEVVESIKSSSSLPNAKAAAMSKINYSTVNKDDEGKRKATHIQRMLANPTKIVTEDEMREEYAYVLSDLKNMGALTVVLMGRYVCIGTVYLR